MVAAAAVNSDPWQARYCVALAACLATGGQAAPDETPLACAHDLGREALAAGCGVLELVATHHRALARLWAERPPTAPAAALARAGLFLGEALGAHEMTHRGFAEAAAALARMHEFVEQEAKRIASGLHDGAGQYLAAVHLKLDELALALPPRRRAQVRDARRLLDRVEDQLRDLAHEMHPAVLDDLGLAPALEAWVETFGRRTGIAARCRAEGVRRWPNAVETALYRVVQEALTNVRKHAHARTVEVTVEDAARFLRCTVADDGTGFDPEVAPRPGAGLGLVSMRERLRALGGTLEVCSRPGRGTAVIATIAQEEMACPFGS